jgi:hypothetical protein
VRSREDLEDEGDVLALRRLDVVSVISAALVLLVAAGVAALLAELDERAQPGQARFMPHPSEWEGAAGYPRLDAAGNGT